MATALVVAGGALISSGTHARAGFQAGTTYALPAPETNIIKADFNGDGKTDLALLGTDLLVYLGNGDGTFKAEAPIALPPNFTDGGELQAGDFNGDGKLDLVIAGVQNAGGVDTRAIWLLTGNGDGTFNAPTMVVSLATPGLVPVGLAVGDFNGDGNLDIAYSTSEAGIVALYGNGHGAFSAGFAYAPGQQTPGPMAIGDFDHDGRDDIAVGATSPTFSAVFVFRCEAAPACLSGYPLPNATDLIAADLNGDGYLDLATPGGVLWGNSTGTFTASTFTVPGSPSAITSAGIDSDGINDLVVVGTVDGSGVVQTLHNLPGAGMTLAAQYPGPDNPLGVVSGDFNGDGRPDLAVFNSTTLSIILGNHQPGPGVNVTAVAGVGSATVSWTPALDDGGSAITGYEVTSSGGATLSVGANVTQVVLYGLNSSAHTFSVTATNAFSTSPPSAPSNTIYPLPGGTTNPLTPARILDTRTSNGGHDFALGPGQTLTLQVAGRGGVPSADVSAVVLNVTVTSPTAASYLSVWPTGLARPVVSNINFHTGEALPNLVEVALGSAGQVSFYNAEGSVQVIADVQGWVGDSLNSYGSAGLFNPLAPARILDTRTTNGGHDFPLGPGQTLTLQVSGRGLVPSSDAEAVVMNVTVTGATASSYLTVWPTGVTRPLASNLNFAAGETIPNRVTVGLSPSGQVSFYNAAGYVNVIADVNGWYTTSGSASGGSAFVGVAPTRIVDTRTSATCSPNPAPCPLGPRGEGAELVATGPLALVMNVTATMPTTSSFLSVFPNPNASEWGGPPPVASDLNFTAGETIANVTTVALGPSPESGYFAVVFYNAVGLVDVVADLDGFYGPAVPPPPATAPFVLQKSHSSPQVALAPEEPAAPHFRRALIMVRGA